jgi:hypothetical protein
LARRIQDEILGLKPRSPRRNHPIHLGQTVKSQIARVALGVCLPLDSRELEQPRKVALSNFVYKRSARATPKMAWKITSTYQCLIRRTIDAADGMRMAWNAGNLLTAITMARSLIETGAIVRNLTDSIKKAGRSERRRCCGHACRRATASAPLPVSANPNLISDRFVKFPLSQNVFRGRVRL